MKRFLIFVLAMLLLVGCLPVSGVLADGKVNIRFRNLDDPSGTNGAHEQTVSSLYTEGTGGVKWAYTSDTDKETPWYYVYCEDYGSVTGVDIAGATHMIFDLYVENIGGLTFFSGDAGINLSDNSGSWNSKAGFVSKADWLGTLQSLQNGWNHVVLPIDTASAVTTLVNRIRMYNVGGAAKAGFYTIIDDIRFVNQTYLDSDDYTDTLAAKEVIAAISGLNGSSSAETVTAVNTAYRALTDNQKALVSNYCLLESLVQEGEADTIVDIQFRSLDDDAGLNGDDVRTLTNLRMEGTGAVKWENTQDKDREFPWYYVYCDNFGTGEGIDIAGAAYMIMDMYVSDATAWTFAGDAGINLSDYAGGGWNSNCGRVLKEDWLSALKTLETGWNHVVLPLDTSTATTSKLWAMRLYCTGGTAPAGFYTVMDDIRFVNQAYLNSQTYENRNAAKAVIAMISALGQTPSEEAIAAAEAAYQNLTADQKALVTNYDELDGREPTPAVNALWSDCDNGEGWATEQSRGTLSVSNEAAVGDGSVQIDGVEEMFFFSVCPVGVVDCTHVSYVDLWFYTSNANIFKNSTDCGFQLSYTDAWTSGGVGVTRSTLKSLTLQEGWNHLTLPLDFSAMTPECDLTKIQRFRFFAVGMGSSFAYTVRLDEVRFVNREGLANADQVIADRVAELIAKIGTVNSYSGPYITAARAAYDALTDERKKRVGNYGVLVAAEEAFAALQEGNGEVVLPDDMLGKPSLIHEEKAWLISGCDTEEALSISGGEEKNIVSLGEESFTAFIALKEQSPVQIIATNTVSVKDIALEALAIKMQIYVSDATAIGPTGQLELTSSGRADVSELHWTTADLGLKDGWNNVYLELKEGETTGGTLDVTNINFMRLYMFLNKDAVMAVDDIRIVERMLPAFHEDFSQAESLDKWHSEADLALENGGLKIKGRGEFSLSASAYPLHILRPDRTPVEFDWRAADPTAVQSITMVFTDNRGKQATAVLDVSKLKADKAVHYLVVPSEMIGEEGYDPETVKNVAFHVTANGEAVLWLDNITTNVRQGNYWRDWVYNHSVEPGDFSIAVIPDIQELTAVYPEKLNTVMQWIADNKDKENIQFAVDVGDLTWNGHSGSRTEFATAAAAFRKLQDAGIDYSVSYGNHDYQSGRDTSLLNEYFPLSMLSTFDSYGGVETDGKVDNIYYCFRVQGIKYMVIALEYDPDAPTLAWANDVVAAHPDYNVIVSVHGYMSNLYGQRLNIGNTIWNEFAGKHENIFMVICGHECLSADPGSMNYREDVGENGNTVYQVMANAQDIDADRGGVGLLLMLRFTNGGNTIDFNYFSPVNDGLAYKEVNQFSVTLPEGQLIVDEQATADYAAAKAVMDRIDALTGEDKEAIAAARTAYDALTDVQKSLVTNLEILEQWEQPVPAYAYGDVNADGTVNAQDALMVLQTAVGKRELNEEQVRAADVDGNGNLNAADALYILQKAVYKISEFPCER